MLELGRAFRDWVLGQTLPDCTVSAIDEDHVRIASDGLTASVSFYCFDDMPEVVELSLVESDSDENLFFLHFELEDLDRAKELFGEMVAALQAAGEAHTTRVLLCCTVGMTTTMFAGRLTQIASTLSLDYAFEAKALEQAKAEGGSYDAVMLAPQVGFRRREVAEAFPQAVVFEIPARVFASYDATGALRTLMGLLGDDTLAAPDPSDLRVVREMKNDKTVMLIEVINHPKSSTIAWRVYDRFTLLASDEVHKRTVSYRDLVDVLATLHLHDVRPRDLDAVGIAVPGPVDYGEVAYASRPFGGVNIEQQLGQKFGVRVFVDNNANAGAVGCYMQQDTYDSVVLHTQQVGYMVGGQGIVANGHLIRGMRGMAGELGSLNDRLFIKGGLHLPEVEELSQGDATLDEVVAKVRDDIPWRACRMLPILASNLVASISIVAPDAIYINYDLIDDMDALREELATSVPEESMPQLVQISDYHEKIFAGEMALVLQRLNTAAS